MNACTASTQSPLAALVSASAKRLSHRAWCPDMADAIVLIDNPTLLDMRPIVNWEEQEFLDSG
ncbi:hypothetical protein SBBP2_310034 [Burkholderiales bacterium]|nr:hypothetical protein SBBP2_310034 [Burkholderiales bacterium]